MPGYRIFGERSDQRNWLLQVRIATALEIGLCLCLIALSVSHQREVAVDLPQPPDMRCLVRVRHAPSELLLRRLSLMKESWKLRVYDPGNPVHDEDLAARQLLGLRQHCNRILHVTDSVQQRYFTGVLRSQQPDGTEIQRLLSVR